MLTIYNKQLKDKLMSKKSGKGKKSKKAEEIEDVMLEGGDTENVYSAVDLGYLVNAIIDYYGETSAQPLDEGDEWKEGTDYAPKPNLSVPKDLDNEVKKAFMAQIKKFQK
jgi:hypothetical protein